MDELLLVGVIAGSFGIKGQVKLKSFTDRPDHLSRKVRTLLVGKDQTPYRLMRLFEHKPGLLILSLDGVTTRDAADELRGAEVFIPANAAAPLDDDEYFLHDLDGLNVFNVDGTPIGTVKEVLVTGANEVLVITRSGQPDALVPMVREFVVELDVPGKRLVIRPIQGLL
jgi:16S rRNA processing protein RimM